ncbi:hypothetical protein BY996DRAFT_8683473 [Phakopsora pachyrhizi]|nr:hypothetical protein BY996DRAFT_8683473 [Phakopsora pachyrhizi]
MFHSFNIFATAVFASFCLLGLSTARLSAPRPAQDQMTCGFYTAANTSSATCNDQPNVVCTKGCTGTFVTATQCTPVNGPEGTTPSTQPALTRWELLVALAKQAAQQHYNGAEPNM